MANVSDDDEAGKKTTKQSFLDTRLDLNKHTHASKFINNVAATQHEDNKFYKINGSSILISSHHTSHSHRPTGAKCCPLSLRSMIFYLKEIILNMKLLKLVKLILNYIMLFFLVLMFYLVIIQAFKLLDNLSNGKSHRDNRRHVYSSLSIDDVEQQDQEMLLESFLAASKSRRSSEEMISQMKEIKNAINEAYVSIEQPIIYCSSQPEKLEGKLDVIKVLDKLNLTSLVEFHDNKTYNNTSNQYMNNTIYYLRDLNLSNCSQRDREFWTLWHTNDMQLLNTTNIAFGDDGARVELGGHWKPRDCKSRQKLAIIVPYRDRLPHLKVLTHYLHMFLQRQMLDYRIFVIEPSLPLNVSFNKGRVFNSAFLEIMKMDPTIDCFILHDVDLLPEDDRNMYTCDSTHTKHLSVAIDKFLYTLPYEYLVGGVFAIRPEQYRLVNGYSNSYWGWGGEDDDLSIRIKIKNLKIQRPPSRLAIYRMMRHKLQQGNEFRHTQLHYTKLNQHKDGLNTVNYKVLNVSLYTGFTYIYVDVGKRPTDFKIIL